jgi:hypothetical protein
VVQRQRDEVLFARERDRASVAEAALGAGLDGRPRAV